MYNNLAEVYDYFQDIDYQSFISYYEKIFQKFSISPKLILDLGCGTGNITIPMAEQGYDMIGLDCSVEMLEIAAKKAREQGKDILFLNQDMSDFELYGTVDAMICALDGVNYLTEDGQLKDMLSLLHFYLNPGGLLIFDINTVYKFKNILDKNTFVYDGEDSYCVWSNEYDEEGKICYFDLNIFKKNNDQTYIRQDEFQQERAYEVEEVLEIVKECNLECVGVYDNLSFSDANEKSERIFFVIRRKV